MKSPSWISNNLSCDVCQQMVGSVLKYSWKTLQPIKNWPLRHPFQTICLARVGDVYSLVQDYGNASKHDPFASVASFCIFG